MRAHFAYEKDWRAMKLDHNLTKKCSIVTPCTNTPVPHHCHLSPAWLSESPAAEAQTPTQSERERERERYIYIYIYMYIYIYRKRRPEGPVFVGLMKSISLI